MTSYSEYIGDGIVKKLEVDFNVKRITIELERWQSEDEPEKIMAAFSGVELQEFWDFGHTTILFDLREVDSFSELMHWHANYFHRMRKYLSSGLVDEITSNTTNRYFSFESTCGFEGFIICKEFQLSNSLTTYS
ncbi:hypothetical protein FY528_12895 [Hymenobacter lutimineralis]|uniref:Uncharacterized protein n=1 Tax=Hymenobacter lutimineralis TaxID=2606448 RepID=A0A5D6UXS7_9BACT|nr:hypothetical protein [Hymenobacter lutimineralis]TYZ08343.1 hypothetical protein FY528_12895 [Hymenobacter lutimineralis]